MILTLVHFDGVTCCVSGNTATTKPSAIIPCVAVGGDADIRPAGSGLTSLLTAGLLSAIIYSQPIANGIHRSVIRQSAAWIIGG